MNITELAMDSIHSNGTVASHKMLISVGGKNAYISDFGVPGAHLVYPVTDGVFAERYALCNQIESMGGIGKTFKLEVSIEATESPDGDSTYIQGKLVIPGAANAVLINMSSVTDPTEADELTKITQADVKVVKTIDIKAVEEFASTIVFE